MKFPITRREDVADVIHGQTIIDHYRFLEDGESGEVKEWVQVQNKFTDTNLRTQTFDIFVKELADGFSVTNFSNPVICKGKYFYSERQPGQEQFAIYVKEGIHGVPVRIVDANGMNEENTISIEYWFVSKTGKYLAYGLASSGGEMPTLYVKNIAEDNIVDEVPRCKAAQVCWLSDDSGFYYKRNPEEGSVPQNEEHLHSRVYYHQLGTSYKNDPIIFGIGRPKDDIISLSITQDGKYLIIHAGQNWTKNEVYLYFTETKQTQLIIKNIPSIFHAYIVADKILIRTNYKANNYRVLWVPLDSTHQASVDEWNELIPESEHLLQSLYITKDKILAEYFINVSSKVVIFDFNGSSISEIPLPAYSNLIGVTTSRESSEFFYGVESLLFPKITYRYDPVDGSFSEYRKTENPINPTEYILKQEWTISKDGTKVPLFVVHRNDLVKSGETPTILYGYGGFKFSATSSFRRNFTPWLKRGGVFVVANIRGGGEFGEAWHKGGIGEQKQNTFDDFIAVAECLIKENYTDKKHLGILGASNGGLLVNAVEVQRPDLFKAVCSQVPLTDMVRFPLFGMAIRWVHEYGNPNNKEDFEKILEWSPYHNVKDSVGYPATLFITGENDSRVNPLHARKMAALLQSVNRQNNIFIYTEQKTGHGTGKPLYKIVETNALMLTFFAKELGLAL